MSKRHIPYFDFYPTDFMHGVRGLTAQEVGVYTMILCRIYEEDGPVEMHLRRLATYCGMREATFKKAIEKLIDLDKFQLEDGRIFNRRATSEISNRAHKLKIASKAGKASAEKRQQNQHPDATDVQRVSNHTNTDTDTDNTSVTNVTDAEASPDPAKVMWDSGVKLLTNSGKSEPQAKKLIGLWRKTYTDAQLIEAIGAAQRAGAVDPASFIPGTLKHRSKIQRQEREGHVNAGAFGQIPLRN